uniref:Uncharacterized protein n=1 Tax=Triticum urartu TaxID=4572 RepID=A0A8R7QZM2_TRIUA
MTSWVGLTTATTAVDPTWSHREGIFCSQRQAGSSLLRVVPQFAARSSSCAKLLSITSFHRGSSPDPSFSCSSATASCISSWHVVATCEQPWPSKTPKKWDLPESCKKPGLMETVSSISRRRLRTDAEAAMGCSDRAHEVMASQQQLLEEAARGLAENARRVAR